jgi:hypothetical protein
MVLFLVSKGLKRHSRPFKLLSKSTIGVLAKDSQKIERLDVPNSLPFNVVTSLSLGQTEEPKDCRP